MKNDVILKVENLHVQYKTDDVTVYALNGMDFEVYRGETLGLVGETGAGKTTTALSILKLLPEKVGRITSGSIQYDGMDIIAAGKKEMLALRGGRIAMIFQDPMTSLNPVMTIGNQIKEVLTLHNPDMEKEEKNAKVDEILKMVGIPAERKHEYPHQFSGGMKQRIVIAMALIAQPELLLADEPTTALDVTIQAQILKLIQDLQKNFNTSMILVTHDLGVVAECCDRVAVVYSGEIIEVGTIEDIFKKEKIHPYTEGLFNCIPDLESTAPRLKTIKGYVVDSTKEIQGCRFFDRCEYCTEKCKNEHPQMIVNGTHGIRCHLYEEGK